MAKQTVTTTQFTDDLDGGKAERTIRFGFDGNSYEIDLSKANSRAFEKAMARYVGHARKLRGGRGRARSAAPPRRDASAVRQWARSAGYEISSRGRVAAAIVAEYEANH